MSTTTSITSTLLSTVSQGLDTASIVSELVAAAEAPATILANTVQDQTAQQALLAGITDDVTALSTAFRAVDIPSEATSVVASTSDSNHVSVAASGGATIGNHDVRVLSTASNQIAVSTGFASNTAGIAGTGGLTISIAGQPDVTVNWDNTDSLSDISSAINNATTGVTSSVLFDGTTYELVVSATNSGTAAAPTFTDSGNGLGLGSAAAITVPASDASMTIDGVTVTRPNNVISDALPGLTFTAISAQADTDPDTKVAVAADIPTMTKTVQTLVTAYNKVEADLSAQLSYTGTVKGPDTLFGDSTLEGLQQGLANLLGSSYGGSTLADLGVTLQEDGTLSLDTGALTTALTANPNLLSTVLTGPNGLSDTLGNFADTYSLPTTGFLASETAGLQTTIDSENTDITNIDTRASALGVTETNEFTAMQQEVSQLQGEQSYLTKIGSTTSSTG